ncbi:39S ribosomal protein L42, mitochondrial [Dunckerocampus dactyliophorus]|uniref:39S ribosomal protein L42, mitochondrial n=1 Tax=Dunckerocampus dactyliophorus TaxID=161453 RepID=UPI002406A945|nr:39S ribosomal protein L42, mitochondrial [Dunckerocampus dactyliophorus]
MASGHLSKINRLLNCCKLQHAQSCLVPSREASSVRGPSIDERSDVEIGLTSDGSTVVCYHPSVDIPYELTHPVERPDPVSSMPENHDQVLKAHLSKEVLRDKQGPTIEELSKMFYTTKHRWYPVGQYHMRRIKKDPPKDR